MIPISDEELTRHLCRSAVTDGVVVETAELKAIRESILIVRMRKCLQLPHEAAWLDETFRVSLRVLRGLWTTDSNLQTVQVRSDWLLGLIDIRGWTHRVDGEAANELARSGQFGQWRLLLVPLADVPTEVQQRYLDWFEDRVLGPAKHQSPRLYELLVQAAKEQIETFVNVVLGKWQDEE